MVRKKLGLTLVSEKTGGERVYRGVPAGQGGVRSAGEILSAMVNQTRRENLSASMSSAPIRVAPGIGRATAPDRTEGAAQSNLPKETSHDPQGKGSMARHRPRRQRQSFHRFRRASRNPLFLQDPLREREG